jgi:hypothetical protein
MLLMHGANMKIVVVSFELDSVFLTEGSILDPSLRDLGVTSQVFTRDPQLLSGR